MFLREKNPQWPDCLISQLDIHLIKLFMGRGMFVVQRGQSNKEMYFQSTLYSIVKTLC
jgi:hypothetical protein